MTVVTVTKKKLSVNQVRVCLFFVHVHVNLSVKKQHSDFRTVAVSKTSCLGELLFGSLVLSPDVQRRIGTT